MSRRMTVLLLILAGLLGVTAAWSYGHMAAARRQAAAAASDTAACSQVAAAIGRLAARPKMASEHERLAAETTSIIERSARAAGIPPERLARISPEASQRVGETAYKAKPTQVFLKDVTLQQLVVFVHTLMGANEGLNVKSIRLSAPRVEDTNNRWRAEVTVTYLIYAPRLER